MATERFPIEAGHILLFARSIGDANPVYYSPDAIAPPTFVQASAQFTDGYVLRPEIGEPWFGSAKEPTGVQRESGGGGGGGTGLHAGQYYEYHQPVKAGDVLRSVDKPGNTWTKEGGRGGTLQFSESVTEYYNQDGELVVTARSVGVQTSQVVKQQ